eukprot:212092-Amphidinium_carterae.1
MTQARRKCWALKTWTRLGVREGTLKLFIRGLCLITDQFNALSRSGDTSTRVIDALVIESVVLLHYPDLSLQERLW